MEKSQENTGQKGNCRERESLRMLSKKTRKLLSEFNINKQSIIARVGEPETDRETELVNLLAHEITPGSEQAYLDWELIIERIIKSGNG